MMQPKFTTFSRSSLQPPHEEIRLNAPAHTPWFLFLEQNGDIAKVYNLIVNHIISDIHPTSLDAIRDTLRWKYVIPHNMIEDTIQFIVTNETKDIEFEEREKSNIRLPLIYRRPRNHVEIVGEYSVFVPSKDLKAQPIGEV
jgi:hypothetical protein